jgi:hypothetical protein
MHARALQGAWQQLERSLTRCILRICSVQVAFLADALSAAELKQEVSLTSTGVPPLGPTAGADSKTLSMIADSRPPLPEKTVWGEHACTACQGAGVCDAIASVPPQVPDVSQPFSLFNALQNGFAHAWKRCAYRALARSHVLVMELMRLPMQPRRWP